MKTSDKDKRPSPPPPRRNYETTKTPTKTKTSPSASVIHELLRGQIFLNNTLKRGYIGFDTAPPNAVVALSKKINSFALIDYDSEGNALGIELTSTIVTLSEILETLDKAEGFKWNLVSQPVRVD